MARKEKPIRTATITMRVRTDHTLEEMSQSQWWKMYLLTGKVHANYGTTPNILDVESVTVKENMPRGRPKGSSATPPVEHSEASASSATEDADG